MPNTPVTRHDFRRYVRGAVIGYLILAAGYFGNNISTHHETTQRRALAASQRHAIVRSGRAVSVDGCNRDFKTITALRSVLTSSQDQLKGYRKQGLVSDEQYKRSAEFYTVQLAKLIVPDCREALNVVTDDPNKPITVPVPFHP